VGAFGVRETGSGKGLAEGGGLGVGAVEDGNVGQSELAVGVAISPAAVQGME
jgi:hypothetical protein